MKKFIVFILFIVFMIGCGKPYIPMATGDCVDRAIVIRQSLKEQGYVAELVIGLNGEKKGHCWVKYQDKETGEWIVFKNYARMTWR